MSVFVVCEAGVSNYGDLELARRQIDAAVAAQADAVKFQAWETASLVSRRAAAQHRDALGADWYTRLEERRLDRGALRELQACAAERGIEFLVSAHDPDSLSFVVEELDVPRLKVGSGEASNRRFLELVGAASRPVLISFGLQDDDEALRAIETLRAAGAPDVVALHCVSLYPTPPELAQLGRIARLRELLGTEVGISDHSVGAHIALAAAALGACAVEKHLTFDRADPRSLDNAGALEPDEWIAFVRSIRDIEAALDAVSEDVRHEALARSRAWALPSIVASRHLEEGALVGVQDVAFKRPGYGGIPVDQVGQVVGRRLRRSVAEDEQIRDEDLDGD